MPAKRYRVRMTAEERKELDGQVNTGTGSGRRLRRARILLMPMKRKRAGAGATPRLPRHWERMRARSSEFGSGVSQPGSKPPSPTRDRNGSDHASWMVRAKPGWCS